MFISRLHVDHLEGELHALFTKGVTGSFVGSVALVATSLNWEL
jgi:hypothetical protein